MEDTKRTKFKVDGVGEINSIEEMASLTGRSIQTITYRIGLGLTDNEIYRSIKVNHCIIDGKKYKKLKRVFNSYGTDYLKARYLLSKGVSLKEVLGINGKRYQNKGKGKPIIVRNVKYDKIIDAYNKHKDEAEVSYNSIRQRIHNGWSGDEAFFIKKNQYRSKQGENNENKKRK